MNWVRVTQTGDIPLREGRAVRVGDDEIAIFNLGDRFLAVRMAARIAAVRWPMGSSPALR